MFDDIDLVPRRSRRRPHSGAREAAEVWLLLAAALVAGILSLFA